MRKIAEKSNCFLTYSYQNISQANWTEHTNEENEKQISWKFHYLIPHT